MRSFISAIGVGLLIATRPAFADPIHVKFDWNIRIGCDGPTVSFPIRDWPAEVHGEVSLSPDKSTSMDIKIGGFMIPTGSAHWDGRVGAKPTSTPGGLADFHVTGPHSLRAIWRQPHNDIYLDFVADEHSCNLTIDVKLHPGETVYTLYNGRNFENCPAIRTVSTTCQAY